MSMSRSESPPTSVRDALNFHLRPQPVAVLAAEIAPADFHARFSRDRAAPISIASSTAARRWRSIAAAPGRSRRRSMPTAMHEAAQVLVGQHDFTSFRASAVPGEIAGEDARPPRVSAGGEEIQIVAEARSFLHHQVRNMVGTLSWWAKARGAERMCSRRWTPATAPPAARPRRRTGSI